MARHMGHAHHFLSRLDRLASAEVELALELYREPELLRAVLAAVPQPEAAERVALALGSASGGPHLVVTRAGHFVTCLGAGMRTGELPVVSRSQLDSLSSRFVALRERLAFAARVSGTNDGVRGYSSLLRRLLVAADSVSREDFLAVSAWEPLLSRAFLDTYLLLSIDVLELGHALRNVRLPRARREEALHDYWNLVHAAAHLALLGAMGGDAQHFQERMANSPELRRAFSCALTTNGAIRFVVQGAWAVGRLGKRMLPVYKRALAEDVAFFDWVDTLFSLVAIGRRSSGSRAEVAKALRATPSRQHQPALRPGLDALRTLAANCVAAADADSAQQLFRAGTVLVQNTQNVRSDRLAELPPDVVRTLPLLSYVDGLTDGKKVALSSRIIAASARGAPEQFYLPQPYAKDWRIRWRPQLSEALLEPMRRGERIQRRPAVRVARPGVNEPCSCGSDRKYKKCCGSPVGVQA